MIANLIFDPKKQIWINLKSYFESYESSNFVCVRVCAGVRTCVRVCARVCACE